MKKQSIFLIKKTPSCDPHYPEWRFLASSAMGTFLEYFDFALYSHTSIIFAHYYFPHNHPQTAILLSWLPFLLGFLARPIGAIFFGQLGDKHGYRRSLCLSMILMAIATIGLGCIPTYNSIGYLSVGLLIFFRLLQGFAVSPEYNGIGVYLSQFGSKHAYYLKSSLTCVMTGLGMMGGGIAISVLTQNYLSILDIPTWRWRSIYWISGLLLGTVGLLLRLSMLSGKPSKPISSPLKTVWKQQRSECLEALWVSGYVGLIAYALFGFFAVYLQTARHYPLATALSEITTCSIIILFVNLLSAHLADRFGATRVLLTSALIIAMTVNFCYQSLAVGTPNDIKLAIFIYGLTTGLFTGVLPGYFSTLFRTEYRFTGACVMYNFGIAPIAGITPGLLFMLSHYSMHLAASLTVFYSLGIAYLFFIKIKRTFRVNTRSTASQDYSSVY